MNSAKWSKSEHVEVAWFSDKYLALEHGDACESCCFCRTIDINNYLVHVECVTKYNCARRCKTHLSKFILDWLFIVTLGDLYSEMLKEVPSRENGTPIRGMKGLTMNIIKSLIFSGTSWSAKIHTMLEESNACSNMSTPSKKKSIPY